MANWIYHAKTDLREYEAVKNSIFALPNQISELDDRILTLKAVAYDKTPVQGGMSGREDKLIDYIDKRHRLEYNLKIAQAKAERIESGLRQLSDVEYRALDYRYIKGMSVRAVCEALGYEESRVHDIKRQALRKFTLGMYGIIDL